MRNAMLWSALLVWPGFVLVAAAAGAAPSFRIGAYLQNPQPPGSAGEAGFEAQAAEFTALMGAAPQLIDVYVDQSQPILPQGSNGGWNGNAGWQAWCNQSSPVAVMMAPVVGVPLFSTATGAGTPDSQFQAFAAGAYDSAIAGVVTQWTTSRVAGFAGFKTIYWRIGWEMNLPGTWFAGADAQSQADWVAAFKHVAGVIRTTAAAQGAVAIIVWNPGTISWGNVIDATRVFYPGDAYVDVIAVDMYADMLPLGAGQNPQEYHDWDTGGEDPTVAGFIADPINRAHYWTYPSGTEWSPQGDTTGHSLSFGNILAFAQARNKPFAVAETGAGNGGSTDVPDDAAFPAWLAAELAMAQASGTTIDFVAIWDSNGGGRYLFTDGTKPQEAAAWAAGFGAAAPPADHYPVIHAGRGPDAVSLWVDETAWQFDAAFTVSVDGVQVGGVMTALAPSPRRRQRVVLRGPWGQGTHLVAVRFFNGGAIGPSFFVTNVTYDGTQASPHMLSFTADGVQTLTVGSAPP